VALEVLLVALEVLLVALEALEALSVASEVLSEDLGDSGLHSSDTQGLVTVSGNKVFGNKIKSGSELVSVRFFSAKIFICTL
jgi:hypothetical protein